MRALRASLVHIRRRISPRAPPRSFSLDGLRPGMGKRDGSTGRGAASPVARRLRHLRTCPVSQFLAPGWRTAGPPFRLPSPDEAAEEIGEVGDGGGFGTGDLGLFVVATEAEGGLPVRVGPEGGLLFF